MKRLAFLVATVALTLAGCTGTGGTGGGTALVVGCDGALRPAVTPAPAAAGETPRPVPSPGCATPPSPDPRITLTVERAEEIANRFAGTTDMQADRGFSVGPAVVQFVRSQGTGRLLILDAASGAVLFLAPAAVDLEWNRNGVTAPSPTPALPATLPVARDAAITAAHGYATERLGGAPAGTVEASLADGPGRATFVVTFGAAGTSGAPGAFVPLEIQVDPVTGGVVAFADRRGGLPFVIPRLSPADAAAAALALPFPTPEPGSPARTEVGPKLQWLTLAISLGLDGTPGAAPDVAWDVTTGVSCADDGSDGWGWCRSQRVIVDAVTGTATIDNP